MKKIKNILFIFVVLLLFVVRVDAADYATDPTLEKDLYKNAWKKNYASEKDEILSEVIVVEDGSISVGSILEGNTNYGLIVKHDNDGKEIWTKKYEVEGTDFYEVLEVEDGFLILGKTSKNSVFIVETNLEGTKISEKTIVEEGYVITDNILSIYNDLLIINLEDAIYTYNLKDDTIDELKTELMYPIANINANGIYVVGNDQKTGDLLLEKYDFEFKKDGSVILAKATVDSNNEFSYIEFATALNDAGDKIIVGSEDADVTVTNTYIVSKDLKLENTIDLGKDYSVYEIEETRYGFGLLLSYKDFDDTCIADEKSALGMDVNVTSSETSACAIVFLVNEYDLNGAKKGTINLPFDSHGFAANINSIIVSGGSDASSVDDFENAGLYDAYLYKYVYTSYNIKTSDDGNGKVNSSKVYGDAGEEIEFTITPNEGYKLVKVTVKTLDGKTLEFTDYKFTMPNADVEIYAEFEKIPENPNTGLSNPYVVCGSILVVALIGSVVVKKKKFI